MLLLALLFVTGSVGAQDWSYTFASATDLSATSGTSNTLNGWQWVLTHNSTSENLYFDTSTYAKGIQIGTGSKPATEMSLTTTSNGTNKIDKIVVNTSGATSIVGTLTVTVGNTQLGDVYNLVRDATSVTFQGTKALSGAIKLAYAQTSSKAIYIKSIDVYYSKELSAPTWTPSAIADGNTYVIYNTGAGQCLTWGLDWQTHAIVSNFAANERYRFKAVADGTNFELVGNNTKVSKTNVFMKDDGGPFLDGSAAQKMPVTFTALPDGSYTIAKASAPTQMIVVDPNLKNTANNFGGVYTKVFFSTADTTYNKWVLMTEDNYLLYAAKMDLYRTIVSAQSVSGASAAVGTATAALQSATSTKTDIDNALGALVKAVRAIKSDFYADLTQRIVDPTAEQGYKANGNHSGVQSWDISGKRYNFQYNSLTTGTGLSLESWSPSNAAPLSRTISQNLTSLPSGMYELTGNVFANYQQAGATTATTGVTFFGNNKSVNVPVAIGDGTSADYKVSNIVVTNGTMTIGVKAENAYMNWNGLDNVSLKYLGSIDAEALKADVQALLLQVQALQGKGQQSTMISLLLAAGAAQTAINNTDVAGLVDAMQNLPVLIDATQKSITAYNSLKDLLATCNATATNTNYPGKAAFTTAISTAQAAYDAAALDVDGINAVTATLKQAANDYKLSLAGTATMDAPVDVTGIIKNPGFDTNADNWTTTAGLGVNLSEIEVFNQNYNFYQVLTDMPKGLYKLTCQGFYRAGGSDVAVTARNNGTEALNAYLYAFVKDTTKVHLSSILDDPSDASLCTTDGWFSDVKVTINGKDGFIPNGMNGARKHFDANGYANNEVVFYVGDEGKATIGLKKDTQITDDWTLFDNFKLTYYGNQYGVDTVVTALGTAATALINGQIYGIYNANTGGRNGFVYENTPTNKQLMIVANKATLTLPAGLNYAFQAVASADGKFAFKNIATGEYIADPSHGGASYCATDPMYFKTTYANGSWTIKGTYSWNANPGSFTGWDNAHPYQFYPVTMGTTESKFDKNYAAQLSTMLKNALALITNKGKIGYPNTYAYPNFENAYAIANKAYANGTCTDAAAFLALYNFKKVYDPFMTITDVVRPTADKYYNISAVYDNRGTLYYDSDIYPYVQTSKRFGKNVEVTNENKFKFAVLSYGDSLYIFNAATKQFIAPQKGGGYGECWAFTDKPTAVNITFMKFGEFHITTAGTNTTLSISPSYNEPIITWDEVGDAGIPMQFTEAGDIDADVFAAFGDYILDTSKMFVIENVYNRGALAYYDTNTDADGNYLVSVFRPQGPMAKSFAPKKNEPVGDVGPDAAAQFPYSFGVYKYNGEQYIYNAASKLFLAPIIKKDAPAGSFGEYWIFTEKPTPTKLTAISTDHFKVSSILNHITKVLSIDTRYTEPVVTYYAQYDEGFPMRLIFGPTMPETIVNDIATRVQQAIITGINSTTAKTITGREYFSTNGAKLPKAAKGVNIVKIQFSDGTTKTQKVVIK